MTFRTAAQHTWRATRTAASVTGRVGGPAASWAVRRAVGDRDIPPVGTLPAGQVVDLPGRGSTLIVDVPGERPDAPPLLLMHGIGTTGMLTWFTVLQALRPHYRVILFDQRWHGRGICSDRFSIADCADDAAAVLDVLGLDQVLVAGYSMGGATAQMLWRRHPDRVAGKVLCSTAARWAGNPGERLFYPTLRVVNRSYHGTAKQRVQARRTRLDLTPPPGTDDLRAWAMAELGSTSPWAYPMVLGELGRFDSRGWLAEVDVPTAVVITGKDRAIPTVRQREMAALIPGVRTFELLGGHASLIFRRDEWLPLFLSALETVAPSPQVEAADG
ncbi:alpha/beta fold hydrolase [Nocardioides limicola]|uniref:alpha/beta fold hydrolase n=1 Tax=Nocardioides limicola TaxID=2803368 RepID=UPI00193C09EA|nr:alpha/beta fold hydrolase [Nocardioides sp. DJM-14]